MGLTACTHGSPSSTPSTGDLSAGGFVVVPMATADAAVPGDGGLDADADPTKTRPRTATRPLPPEQTPPIRMNCVREVSCHAEEDDVPPLPFPAPFERCAATAGKSRDAELSVRETNDARQGDPHACCYVEFRNCNRNVRPMVGRPLRDTQEAPVVAPQVVRRDWDTAIGDVEKERLSPAERARLARHFRDDAAIEHASIASFARFALQLMALGAPADLVRDAHAAALDEIAHTRVSFGIARAYDGDARGPGALPIDDVPMVTSLAAFAADTLRDGCINETLAATVAREQAQNAVDPAVRDALGKIADDEEAHAELAWRTVAWAVRTGGSAVTARLRETLSILAVERSPVMLEVIRPCAEALLS